MSEGQGPRRASLVQLIFLTYAVICGGAYGLEEMISTSGPGMSFVLLAVVPIIWAVPVSLACAELSARFPVEGGYYRWARMAFGDRIGYLAGWLVWLSTFATNAVFAVLFADYTRKWLPSQGSGTHFAIAVALVWLTIYLNYRGIHLVGTLSIALTIFIFIPFFWMTLLGILHYRSNPLVPFTPPNTSIESAVGGSLFLVIWLYAGFEKLSTTAEEVDNPARAFPIALAFAVPMAAGSYIIPTFAALAANGDWKEWGPSHFTEAAQALGGPFLGNLMAAGGLVANACLLMATLLAQSRLPMVLAQDGLFPQVFRKTHPRYGSPVASLLVGGLVLTALCGLGFASLTGLYALVQVSAYLLIYAALFRLRGRPRTDHEGFRIPLGQGGLLALIAPSIALALFVIFHGLWHDGHFDKGQVLVDLAIFASGPLSYALIRRTAPPSAARVL